MLSRVSAMLLWTAIAVPALAQQGPRISAGSPGVDGSRIEPGNWTMRYLRVEDGQEREVGRVTIEIARQIVDGEAAFRIVQRAETPRGITADTAVSLARTLHPLTHRSHNPVRTLDLSFDGMRVTGSMVPAEGEEQAVDHALDEPAFDGNNLDILFGALPLREGYAGTVVAYIFEAGGSIDVPFRVKGKTTIESEGRSREAWELEITYPIGSGRFWIDRETGQPLAAEIETTAGVVTRVVR